MDDEQRLTTGFDNFNKVYGGVIPAPKTTDPTSFAGITLGHLFCDIWGRDKLPMRERRLIVMGALAGLGADPSLFEIHARSAIRNGELSLDDLRETIITALYYIGFPRASPLYLVVEKLAAEERAAAAAAAEPKGGTV